jgi:hypothetical protein
VIIGHRPAVLLVFLPPLTLLLRQEGCEYRWPIPIVVRPVAQCLLLSPKRQRFSLPLFQQMFILACSCHAPSPSPSRISRSIHVELVCPCSYLVQNPAVFVVVVASAVDLTEQDM